MKINTMRAVAVALGLGACSIAHADSSYTSPAKWNNFRPISDKGEKTAVEEVDTKAVKKAAKKKEPAAELPPPVPTPDREIASESPAAEANSTETLSPVPMMSESIGAACQHAMGAPCAAARPPLASYFGGANLLFLTLENGGGRNVVTGLGSDFTTSIVRPRATTGFDVSVGRYLDGGRYGLGVTYMLWNPSGESLIRTGPAGSLATANAGYALVTNGDTGNTVYDDIGLSAAGTRLRRDIRFQGIEANLFSFGLMGARRIAYADCQGGSLLGGRLGRGLGLARGCKGYGGATGPLVRGGGRVRVMTSHGFRWLQIDDEFESAYNIDTVAGYQASDLYDNVDVQNNLYGYQFGARLTYCLSSRINLNVGGKFGIYGNHAEMRHRLGTQTAAAYRNGMPADLIDTESSDTVLSTLGELDLGLGYRLGCAWTIRGGYRLFGITGVANAADSIPYDYSSVAASGQVHADDCYVLHGGYLGMEYNW